MPVTDIDFSTSTWVAIVRWAQSELDSARQKNDGALSEADTAALRGEIRFAKKLLGLPASVARDKQLSAPAQ